MSSNPVLESTRPVIEDPNYLSIHSEAIDELADAYADEEFGYVPWNFPPFPGPDADPAYVTRLFIIGNTQNFCFRNPGGEKFQYGDASPGSSSMWAALQDAAEENPDLLRGEGLRDLAYEDVKEMFTGKNTIPLLEERHEILQEVGNVLCENYDGDPLEIVEAADQQLYENGDGFVERLVHDFPTAFDDAWKWNGNEVRFDKRAQLAGGMLYGRVQDNPEHPAHWDDIADLTVFADYQVPKLLRKEGVLEYDEELACKVDKGVEIPAGSQEELELRAATIHTCDALIQQINAERSDEITAVQLDGQLWNDARSLDADHHITRTTAY